MRRLIATSIFTILAIGCAGGVAAQTAKTAADKTAAARDLKAAQAICAARTGAAKDGCLTDAQTRYGKTAVGSGQYGYVPANGNGTAAVTRNRKALPPHSAKSQRTMDDLGKTKLPSNESTDVARAAQQVKDAAKAGNK
jgi:hypothetical protein